MPKGKKKEVFNVITCEVLRGGFLFSVSDTPFIAEDKRIVTDGADAITIFANLIHGNKLADIKLPRRPKIGGE